MDDLQKRIEARKQHSLQMRVAIVGAGTDEDPRRPDLPTEGHYHVDWDSEAGGKVTVWFNKDENDNTKLGAVRSAIQSEPTRFELVKENTSSKSKAQRERELK